MTSTNAAQARVFETLMTQVAEQRDRNAFMALFDHFAPRIKSYLMRLGCDPGLADDLAQEAMLTVWRRADTFKPEQARVSTWIFTIARNKRIDVLRKERHPELDPTDPALVPDQPMQADAVVGALDEAAHLKSAIEELPKAQGDLIRLAFYDDMAHGEIAAVTGLPLGTVKSRLRLAMAKLRKSLEDRYDGPDDFSRLNDDGK